MLTLDELKELAADYREQAAALIEEAEALEREILERQKFINDLVTD